MAEWLRRVTESLATLGLIPAWCWNSLQPLGHFAWHRARQGNDTHAFYIAVLSIIFLLLGFRQWRSSTDRILTLNMNIWLPLFWSTWIPALGPDSATCAGLAHGRDYSGSRASGLKLQKCLATVLPWIVEILLYNGLQWGFSNPHPQEWHTTLYVESVYFSRQHAVTMACLMRSKSHPPWLLKI